MPVLLYLTVAFLGSWTPYAIMVLYISITKSSQINLVFLAIALLLAKSSPIWNPYIYFFRDKQFSRECHELLPFLARLGSWRNRPGNRNMHLQLDSFVCIMPTPIVTSGEVVEGI
jgi:hypothetical protein